MNCTEYRRLIETDPSSCAEVLSAHAAGCAGCSDFTRRVRRLDRRLHEALLVPVPEDLEARILLRQAFQEPRQHPARRRPVWALAASVLLVLGLAFSGGWIYYDAQKALERDVIAVVNTATYAMDARGPVSPEQVATAFEPIGFRLTESLGKVSFAGKCLVQGKVAGHMILRRDGQPITLIFIPDRLRLHLASFASDRWRGMLVPVESGTVAIVAPPEQALGELSRRVKRLVHWTNTA